MQPQSPLPITSPLTIISGGQTGADLGGLVAASFCKIPTTGYATAGFRTERGKQPVLGSKYGLIEHTEVGYDKRTIANASVADLTLIFATNPDSSGTKLTVKSCLDADKGYYIIDDFSRESQLKVLSYLNCMEPKVINIAGNRETVSPGLTTKTRDFLKWVLPQYKINLQTLINMENNDDSTK